MFSVISDEGQRNELEAFYKENLNCFLSLADLSLNNKTDAEDAVQEAFRRIAGNPDNFFKVSPPNRVKYVLAIIRNISFDMLNKKNKVSFDGLGEEIGNDEPSISLEDSVIEKISRDELKKFIKTLPPLQRDVLTLRYLVGFSTAETAKELNISHSAVKERLRLAKEAVREYIRRKDELYE